MLEDLGSVLSKLGPRLDAVFHRRTFMTAAETFLALALGHKSGLKNVNLHLVSPDDLAKMVLAEESKGLKLACRTVPYLPQGATEEQAMNQVVGLYVSPGDCYAIDRLVPGLSSSLAEAQSTTLVHEAGHALIDRRRRIHGIGNLSDEQQVKADHFCDDLAGVFRQYVFGPVACQPDPVDIRAEMQARFRELTRPAIGYGRPSRWHAAYAAVQARNATASRATTASSATSF